MQGFLGKRGEKTTSFCGRRNSLTMERWEDGTNYSGKEILVLFVFSGSLSFTSSLQQPQFQSLAYLLPSGRKSRSCIILLLFK